MVEGRWKWGQVVDEGHRPYRGTEDVAPHLWEGNSLKYVHNPAGSRSLCWVTACSSHTTKVSVTSRSVVLRGTPCVGRPPLVWLEMETHHVPWLAWTLNWKVMAIASRWQADAVHTVYNFLKGRGKSLEEWFWSLIVCFYSRPHCLLHIVCWAPLPYASLKVHETISFSKTRNTDTSSIQEHYE